MLKLLQATKICDGCGANICDDSFTVMKCTATGVDAGEQQCEMNVCKKCTENIQFIKNFVMANVEPNENGDYVWGGITVRG